MGVAGEPFYRDLFRFSGRRRRGSYFNVWLVVLFFYFTVALIAAALSTIGYSELPAWIYAAPAAIPINIAGAQRCRDIGWTGWAVFLNYIPVIGVAIFLTLLFYPGMRGPNRYGPDPLETDRPAAV